MAALEIDVVPDVVGVGSWHVMDDDGVRAGTAIQIIAGDATIVARITRETAKEVAELLLADPEVVEDG